MLLNRRGFLGSLAAAAAALTLDPEKALWVPGAKVISIPQPPVKMVLEIGDVFTIMGYYAVNPRTREVAEYIDPKTRKRHKVLQRYVAVHPVTTSDFKDVAMFPIVLPDGSYQNTAIEPISEKHREMQRAGKTALFNVKTLLFSWAEE